MTSRADESGREPLAPDVNGFCYRDEQHFDETMTRVARDQLARHASLLESRIVPYALWIGAGASVFICAGTGYLAGLGVLAIVALGLLATAGWETRRSRAIETQRLCFKCGYSLMGLATNDAGWARCPECGRPFCAAHYRRPPPLYRRAAAGEQQTTAEAYKAEPSTANSMRNATPLIDRRDRQVWLFRLHRPYEFVSPCPDREFALLLVIADETVSADEQWALSTQLVHQSCRYAVCFGYKCSSWDDAIDMVTVVEEVDGAPTRPHVMTTWHDTDTLQETVEYFARNTRFDDWVPSRFVAVILGGDKRMERSVRKALRKHLG